MSIEELISASHPLRRIWKLADQAYERLNSPSCELYALEGLPSVPLEQLHCNLLFRWFVGLRTDDPMWHSTTFTKNREPLFNDEIMGHSLKILMVALEVKPLLSDEHSSVDGTLLQTWASHAPLERIDGQDDLPPLPSWPCEGFGQPKGLK